MIGLEIYYYYRRNEEFNNWLVIRSFVKIL